MNLEMPERAVIAVGDGRGFIVRANNWSDSLVITAAHCLPKLPPAHPWAYLEEITYQGLLGPLDGERSIWAECLFADPVGDIAVLTGPDNQELGDEAEKYGALIEACQGGLRAGLPPKDKGAGWLLSLENNPVACTIESPAHTINITDVAGEIAAGMSGSPIFNESGEAVGVVSTSSGTATGPAGHTTGYLEPCLSEALPGWIWKQLVQKRPCPQCAGEAVPILYGFPLPEDGEAEKRGEIKIGGCVVEEDMPAWHCRGCGHEFADDL